jgi:hypothetical protein
LNTVERLRFIRSGIAASAFVHLSILAVILFFAEVHPFESVTAEPITVDIVSPEEAPPAPQKEEPPAKKDEVPLLPKFQLTDSFAAPAKSAPAAQTASTAPQSAAAPQQKQSAATSAQKQATAAPPQKQAAATPPQRQAALSTPPADQPQAAAPLPQEPASAAPAYTPPEPDVTVKYHVLLGLPPELPQGQPRSKPGNGFDAEASEKADVASSLVTEFRNHLRTCSKLPASIAASDVLRIKLRVFMTPQGGMAAEPAVIEGTPSLKALDLRQSAVDALKACQPYKMLPADRYGEWKVLDLSFTPRDFNS